MLKRSILYPSSLPRYTTSQLSALVFLRILIGWHFLYEGIAKVLNPYWTSAGFLLESKWIFSGIFTSMAANPVVLKIVDFMNMWGLIAIGLGLIVGCLARVASMAGILLLLLYYVANPPFIGFTYTAPLEGSYLIVNKNLIETFALLVLSLFPTGCIIGLDRLIFSPKKAQ
ncbi:DoxX family membrane protein [Candidatus Latescibacterota bacterium]